MARCSRNSGIPTCARRSRRRLPIPSASRRGRRAARPRGGSAALDVRGARSHALSVPAPGLRRARDGRHARPRCSPQRGERSRGGGVPRRRIRLYPDIAASCLRDVTTLDAHDAATGPLADARRRPRRRCRRADVRAPIATSRLADSRRNRFKYSWPHDRYRLHKAVLAFLVTLSVLVVIHELGHYLIARWCGVKVLRFSVGFGRVIVVAQAFRRAIGTEWALSAHPARRLRQDARRARGRRASRRPRSRVQPPERT